jgi:hypothetical protein
VTGALPPAFEVPVESDEEAEEEQPASNRAVPIAAAVITRRI